jgi:hypothetical protein
VRYVVKEDVRAIFFFEATVAGSAYLTVLEDNILRINILRSGEDCFFFVGWDLRHQVLRPLLA